MAGTRKVRWSWGAFALVLGMFTLGGSVAVAAIPQGNTFNGCVSSSSGALRLIDTGAGAKCTTTERFVKWNRWNWRGIWLASSRYNVGDVVAYKGSSYVARVVPPIGTLPTNTTYFSLIASKGAIGLRGVPGLKGATGLLGPTGLTGPTGIQGVQGVQGVPGVQGVQGLVGATGVQGLPGVTGATGLQGIQGLLGPTGPTGPQGIPGLVGATGVQGLAGATGVQGIQGLLGPTGAQGIQGLVGVTGATGLPGVTGATGLTGATGVVDAIFAKINSNGTLAFGHHVSTSSVSLGTYTITFDQNVSQCAVSVIPEQTVALPLITAHTGSAISLTLGLPALPTTLLSAPFNVTVTC